MLELKPIIKFHAKRLSIHIDGHKRNYATSGLTLVSVYILSRKRQNSPWFYLDEWPWA